MSNLETRSPLQPRAEFEQRALKDLPGPAAWARVELRHESGDTI